ncbi:MAG TPA: glycosyltransferase family 87 protein [Vicinamibacterales bacterium]
MPILRPSATRTRALLVVLAAVSVVALFTTRVSRKMPDFQVYRTAAARALAAEPLYREEDGHYQFKYLPAFAVLAAPAALMPEEAAKAAWFVASALLMTALLGLSVRAMPRLRRPAALLLVLTFLAMAKFYAHELVLGQVNLLLGALAALAIVCLRNRRDAAAGLLLALAVVVKPYAAIFAPWLATRRNRTAFATMTAGMVVLLLLPAVRYGWAGNLRLLADWWHTVAATTAPNLTNPDNVSLGSLFAKWLGTDSNARILAAAAAVLLLALTGVVIAGRGGLSTPETLEASMLLLLIPLISPQGWDYVLLIGTPAVMLLVNEDASLPRGLRVATIAAIVLVGLTVYDLVGRGFYTAFMQLSVVTVCVAIEIAALAVLRFRRVA